MFIKNIFLQKKNYLNYAKKILQKNYYGKDTKHIKNKLIFFEHCFRFRTK